MLSRSKLNNRDPEKITGHQYSTRAHCLLYFSPKGETWEVDQSNFYQGEKNMNHNRTILLALSVLAVAAILLAACGPKATPEPVTLTVSGMVNSELKLSDSALHKMTLVTLNLTHPKSGAADYTGVRLNDLLKKAGVKDGAATVTFTANDGFSSDLDLATVLACADCLVAFDATTPGVYNFAAAGQTSGKAWVKGLVSITVK
jgi:hypothetical protein